MICSRCGGERDRPGHRYCRACHNAYQRENRPKYRELSATDQHRSSVRATANTYVRRGKLIPQPCEQCGSEENIEKHHDDYSKPLAVRWLCRRCHLELP